jgi:hypothetical protein
VLTLRERCEALIDFMECDYRESERERCEWAEVRLPERHAAPRPVACVSRQPVPRRASLAVRHRSRQVRLYVGCPC